MPGHQVVNNPTYASILDPDSGNSLNFIPANLVNGISCAKLELEDVMDELEYWKSSVLCSVLGSNPPLEIIQKYIRRLWAQFEIDQILQIRRGIFLVRFIHQQDQLSVLRRGFYFFGNKPLVVKGWNADLTMNTDNLKSIPLWIRLPNLELRYWGLSSLSKIGSMIGTPIKTDHYTKSKSMIHYARLLIEVPIEGPFPDYVDFFNEKGQLIRQQVQFEWKPIKCTHCHMLGHTHDVCKKKKDARKEWRSISKLTPLPVQGNPPSPIRALETDASTSPRTIHNATSIDMMEENPGLEPPAIPPTSKMGTTQIPGAHLTHQAHHREGRGVPDMERVY